MERDMGFDFNTSVNRLDSDSSKWQRYGKDVLPMWVADMDFMSPQPILDAVHERVRHGVFGYSVPPKELREALVDRAATRHQWTITTDDVTFLPGLVCGLNVVCRAIGEPGL